MRQLHTAAYGWLALLALALPGWAAPPIAVVVAPARAKEALDAAQLSLIFQRRRLQWADGRRMLPLNLPAGDPLREQFSVSVLGKPSAELEDYWNRQYFQGLRPPHVVASAEAMLRFIAANPDAIGYLALCSADPRVSVMALIDEHGRLLAPAPQALPACAP